MTALTSAEQAQLIEAARQVYENAYAPYSHYQVGAALLSTSGRVFTGCNVENAAYPASICAERSAITTAVSEGERQFSAIAVVTRDGGTPCGICRQVLNEFAPEIVVIIANAQGEVLMIESLNALLPHGFGPANLKDHGGS